MLQETHKGKKKGYAKSVGGMPTELSLSPGFFELRRQKIEIGKTKSMRTSDVNQGWRV